MSFDTRHAELSKYYKKISNSFKKFGIEQVRSTSQYYISSPLIVEGKNAVVLTGMNGSGKTQILKLLAQDTDEDAAEFFNTTFHLHPNSKFLYYSPSDRVIALKNFFSAHLNDEIREEVLQQLEPYSFKPDELKWINYILATNFNQIDIYEVEDNDEVFEYIVAVEDGFERNMDKLSHGEIYCINLLFFLKKFNHGDNNVLMIDEPETYLYPKAQVQLLDAILVNGNLGSSQLIFATHSPDIVSRLKESCVLQISRSAPSHFLIKSYKQPKLDIPELGLGARYKAQIVLEDNKALMFLKCIDNHFSSEKRFAFCTASDGAGSLIKFYKAINHKGSFKNLICFDADAIEKEIIPKDFDNEFYTLLPGTSSPEEELIEISKSKNNEFLNFIKSKEMDVATFNQVYREHYNANHHDYFLYISQGLSKEGGDSTLSEFELFEMYFEFWIALESNEVMCGKFYSDLESKLGLSKS